MENAIIYLVLTVVGFILGRAIITWYFKINIIVAELRKINKHFEWEQSHAAECCPEKVERDDTA